MQHLLLALLPAVLALLRPTLQQPRPGAADFAAAAGSPTVPDKARFELIYSKTCFSDAPAAATAHASCAWPFKTTSSAADLIAGVLLSELHVTP